MTQNCEITAGIYRDESGVYTGAHVRRTCTPYMCARVNTAEDSTSAGARAHVNINMHRPIFSAAHVGAGD